MFLIESYAKNLKEADLNQKSVLEKGVCTDSIRTAQPLQIVAAAKQWGLETLAWVVVSCMTLN